MRKEILDYYASGIEAIRLDKDALEKIRTQQIISGYLSESPLRILDAGGGAGVYSYWLKQLGHEVHLIDPSPVNIESAKKFGKESGYELDQVQEGTAELLPYENDSFDLVLLLGPLYHLTDKEDRIKLLQEVRRVLKNGGKIFGAAISRFASALDGFSRNLVADDAFISIMQQDLQTGQHRNPTGNFEYFTTAFFHHPYEIKNELKERGFFDEEVVAVESFGWLIPFFQEKWKDEKFKELLLTTIASVEKDPSILGISAHLIAIGTKK
jgi:SAM-dependent methyltransferase